MVKNQKKQSEDKKTIEEEVGDLLFVLICFANSLHIDLEEAHDRVMEKFNTRDKDRWTRNKIRENKNGKYIKLSLLDLVEEWVQRL